MDYELLAKVIYDSLSHSYFYILIISRICACDSTENKYIKHDDANAYTILIKAVIFLCSLINHDVQYVIIIIYEAWLES